MKIVFFLIVWVLSVGPVLAFSKSGSQSVVEDSIEFCPDKTVEFKPYKLVLPLSLIAAGAIGSSVPQLNNLNKYVRGQVEDLRDGHYMHADDYLQYAPVAGYFGLSLCGAKAKHSYLDRLCVGATSALTMAVLVNGIKYAVRKPRPDSSARNSFPSGHTATAFMGAELVRMEYRDDSPWYGIGAYAIATGVGLLRIYNERHWTFDVLAGAGVGILSARIGYWLLPFEQKLFGLNKQEKGPRVSAVPFYDPMADGWGGAVAVTF